MNCGCSHDACALHYSERSPSWCKYKREIVTTRGKVITGGKKNRGGNVTNRGKKNYGKERKSTKKDDPKKISDTVFHYIKPVFERLVNKTLLKRCIDGLTQNPNESLHSLIWNFCPKTSFCGCITVETAVCLAIAQFNNGYSCHARVLERMHVTPGSNTISALERFDKLRLKRAERKENSSK